MGTINDVIYYGADHPNAGQVKETVQVTIPNPPSGTRSVSRVRFDAIFAAACGEAYYLNALRALAAIAATNPATDATAAIARGLAALDNPPVAGIDYPIGDWKNSPNPSDITGALLLGIIAALVNVQGFSDIETKVDQALALWSTL